ncbi:hypothetical protein GQ55_7G211100 [Panicum hallii var. hallii]|uniref:Late embryogenesis abundant protein LEA-2 subgroup domain-containing protein n=1 Tax=Panicum hallii var. hallii TaxID=1504633 RepID=A0A2T7CXD7_9POAL|nr:hypothetical protein GQ55_7G211100 [Panicum hallii var. hallii]
MDARLLSGRSDDELPSHREEEPTSTAIAVTALISLAVLACGALLLVSLLPWGMFMMLTTRLPVFSVTVDRFAGLEDRVPRAFNLTLGIDNLGGEYDVCVGGEAVVLYGGVPLAVGRVEELCVPRNGAADLAVVAASGGVGVPKALAELMAGEKRADGAVHAEVRVISAKHSWFLSCTAALEQGAARPYPCKKSSMVDESDGVRPDSSRRPALAQHAQLGPV